jgi:D-cysteine desulfhydrase
VTVPQLQTDHYPLFDRFPALRRIPYVRLCDLPSPVQSLDAIAPDLWIKRDDLNAHVCGGNKVRALEFLLGGLDRGDSVVTVGGTGSTHILATAIHAARLGVSTWGVRWKHAMNPVAIEVSDRIESMIERCPVHMLPVVPIARARFRAIVRRSRYIPVGGSVPLGVLGHLNGALELVRQINAGQLPIPREVIVPMGTGGTAAGLLLGFALAGLHIEVVGVRTGPRAFANRRAVLALARRTLHLVEKVSGESIDVAYADRMRVVHSSYGGGYGRPAPGAERATHELLEKTGILLDDTYTAKAWLATLAERRSVSGPLVYWFTFDQSCLTSSPSTSTPATATRRVTSITR